MSPAPGLAGKCADLQLDGTRRHDRVAGLRVLLDRRREVTALGLRLCPCQDRLGPCALIARDAACEEGRVDAEPAREPADRLGGRTRLAALDLRDVLLREAVAGKIGLCQAGRHAQGAHTIAEA